MVDDDIDVSIKILYFVKKTNEKSDYLKFYVYFCHVIDDFYLFYFAALK